MDIIVGLFSFLLLFLFFKKQAKYYYSIRNIVYSAIFIRLCFAFYHLYLGPFPIIGVLPDSGNDELYFTEYASNFPDSMILGLEELFTIHLYPIVLGVFFKIFGTYPFVGAALNSFFGILILINVYKISKLLWGNKVAKRAAFLYLLIPMQAAYSVILIREALFTCLLISSIYLFMNWSFNNKKTTQLIYSLLCLLFAVFLHDAVIIVLLPMLYHLFKKRIKGGGVFKVALISGLIFMVLFGGVLNYTLRKISEEGLSIEKLEGVRENLRAKNRQFSYSSDTNNPASLLFHFTIRPFIWEYHTGFFRIFNTLLLYFLIFVSVKKFTNIRKNPKSKMLVSSICLLLLVFAFGSGDLYQSDRHRSKILPLIIALVPIKKYHFR